MASKKTKWSKLMLCRGKLIANLCISATTLLCSCASWLLVVEVPQNHGKWNFMKYDKSHLLWWAMLFFNNIKNIFFFLNFGRYCNWLYLFQIEPVNITTFFNSISYQRWTKEISIYPTIKLSEMSAGRRPEEVNQGWEAGGQKRDPHNHNVREIKQSAVLVSLHQNKLNHSEIIAERERITIH